MVRLDGGWEKVGNSHGRRSEKHREHMEKDRENILQPLDVVETHLVVFCDGKSPANQSQIICF